MVAMELAASLRPFRKSNASAMTISPPSSSIALSHMLDDDAADAVGHVFEPVHYLLQMIVDFNAYDVTHRIAFAMFEEQILDAGVVERVGVVLKANDFFGDGVQPCRIVAQRGKEPDGIDGELRGLEDARAHFRHFRLKLLHF